MGRHYQVAEVKALVSKLIGSRPDAAIGLDVICGFPGETESEFEQTYSLIDSLPIAYLHVFGYSKRKGTPAAAMKNQIHGSIIKTRVQRLLELSTKKKQCYEAMLIDKQTILHGIIERVDAGIGTALSDHYIRIYGKVTGLKVNDYVQWQAADSYADGLISRDYD
jgi:threonylcarbamoyladenosine tRNA methylthiotransferase MtaB